MASIMQMTPNQIAARIQKTGQSMLKTPEWKALRAMVIAKYGRRCMKCGFIPKRGQCINVDHIKPRLFYPELTWEFENLQILCEPCNQAKGNKHCTDYRPQVSTCLVYGAKT